jgi:hypothetical protein
MLFMDAVSAEKLVSSSCDNIAINVPDDRSDDAVGEVVAAVVVAGADSEELADVPVDTSLIADAENRAADPYKLEFDVICIVSSSFNGKQCKQRLRRVKLRYKSTSQMRCQRKVGRICTMTSEPLGQIFPTCR